MEKNKKPISLKTAADETHLQLIAVADSETDSRCRIKTVQALVTEMILIGEKRGRPKKQIEELSDAA